MNFTKTILTTALLATSVFVAEAQFKVNTKTIGAASKAVKAVTLSNEDVIGYVKEYVVWMDEHNPVAPADHEFAMRLEKLTKNLKGYDGQSLNFKVYLVRDINAFACADGSVRVCAGLMNVMTDNEVLGVIGHEIGHVKNQDSKDAFRTALITSALKDGASSQGGVAGTLSDSEFGEVSEKVANMSFSRKQESMADQYGYIFLKENNVNPWYMAMAFEKLLSVSGGASEDASFTKRIFSSHPDTQKRVAEMSKRAEKDGFKKPTE